MKESLIHQAYEIAKERYAELGIDTEKVLEQLQNFHLSMHCWQADDVKGFEAAQVLFQCRYRARRNVPLRSHTPDE